MRDHAIEARDILESSISNQNLNRATSGTSATTHQRNTANPRADSSIMDNSDTMAQLNLMISKFESLSQQQNIPHQTKGSAKIENNSRSRLVISFQEVTYSFCYNTTNGTASFKVLS